MQTFCNNAFYINMHQCLGKRIKRIKCLWLGIRLRVLPHNIIQPAINCSNLTIFYFLATPLTSFWCLYCQLWTYFTPCFSALILNFEQVNAGWVSSQDTRGKFYSWRHDVDSWLHVVRRVILKTNLFDTKFGLSECWLECI